MKKLKSLIFKELEKNNVTNEEIQKLVFGIFKESVKTKQLNPAVWLYLNNSIDSFETILEDIVHQTLCEYYTDKETAFKNMYKYIYYTYYRTQTTTRPIEYYETETSISIDHYTVQQTYKTYEIRLDSVEKQAYYTNLLLRTQKNSKKRGGVFKDNRQKQKTINQLKRLQIID